MRKAYGDYSANAVGGSLSAIMGNLSPRRRRKKGKSSRRMVRRTHKRRMGRSKARRGVKYTKTGQPYIILKSGKARFIKGRRHKR